MDFYQLLYFKKVSETNSFTRAAEELLLTQPAVSKQIKALEEELGEKLFDRIGKKVFPTKAGEILYSYADRILNSVYEAKTAVKYPLDKCSGELVIGISDHIGLHRLPPVLKSYITSYPEVDLKLRCHRSETILDMVNKNLVDLGVITLPCTRRFRALPRASNRLISKIIWEDPMSLVFSRDHPLNTIKSIRLKDIVRHGMILPEVGTTTRKVINDVFSKKRLTPKVNMEVVYLETIKVFVKVGLGISILPDKAIEQEVTTGALIKSKIQDASFSRTLGVVYLKNKFLSRPAIEFLNFLENKTIEVKPR